MTTPKPRHKMTEAEKWLNKKPRPKPTPKSLNAFQFAERLLPRNDAFRKGG